LVLANGGVVVMNGPNAIVLYDNINHTNLNLNNDNNNNNKGNYGYSDGVTPIMNNSNFNNGVSQNNNANVLNIN